MLAEFAELNGEEFEQTTTAVLSQEVRTPLHLIRIGYPQRSFVASSANRPMRGGKQSDILREKGMRTVGYIKNHQIWGNIRNRVDTLSFENNAGSKYAFITLGVIILVFLLYIIFRGLSGVVTSGSDELRDKVLQAKTLIDTSQTLTSNPEAFEQNIKQAEEILFSLRNEQAYLSDTQDLLNRIDALKREVYDIQTVKLADRTPIVATTGSMIPLNVGQANNKLTIVGKSNIVKDYVPGSVLDTPVSYPQDEEAIDMDITANGTVYVLTKSHRIFTLNGQQNTIVPVTV